MRSSIRLSVFVAFIMGALGVSAQSDVYLQINHKLDTEPFEFSVEHNNNLGEEFNVTRLEYYMSNINLVHDGGVETTVPDTWVLVNAGTFTNVYLGNFDITNLESISFGIGVEYDYNHLDPSSYPSDHPLAPKSPSMHWGWASGYRFVAMEGKAGTGLTQTYEIHALGDVNYQSAEVVTTGTWNEGTLYVAMDGDYTMALQDVSVAGGLINHGETGEAADLLVNFNQDVFKEGEATVVLGINDWVSGIDLHMAPNPATNQVGVQFNQQLPAGCIVSIRDMRGSELLRMPASSQMNIDLHAIPAGLYNLSVENENMVLTTKKMVVNK